MKLVLIDNHGLFMEGLSSCLEQFSDIDNVFTFYSEEKVKIQNCIKDEWIDLFLIDINLDGISGFDFADELREEDPELPIAFITGHGNQPNLRAEALEHGAIGFF